MPEIAYSIESDSESDWTQDEESQVLLKRHQEHNSDREESP